MGEVVTGTHIQMLGFTMEGSKYQTVEECIVEAGIDAVWHVITDFPGYSKWSPGIRQIQIDGALKPGTQGIIRFPLRGEKLTTMPIELTRVENGTYLEWQGYPRGLRGLVRGNHYHRLEKLGPTRTRLLHGEYFTGIGARVAWSIVGQAYVAGFIKSTAAIKAEAERGS